MEPTSPRRKAPASVQVAFAAAPRPLERDIVPAHPCEECDTLRRRFAPHPSSAVPVSVLRGHVFDLSLFAPVAYRYYLPAFLALAGEPGPDGLTEREFESVLYSLYPSGPRSEPSAHEARFACFTRAEAEAIVSVLTMAAADVRYHALGDEIREALELWWLPRLRS